MFLDAQQRVGDLLLFALVGVRDGDATVLVPVVVDDLLLEITDNNDEFTGTEFDELVETMSDGRRLVDLDHTLRLSLVSGRSCVPSPPAGTTVFMSVIPLDIFTQ